MIEDLFVPVLTPFAEDGAVDVAALTAHCRWVTARGARGVMVFGTTGEGPSVTAAEKTRVARAVTAELPGTPVIGAVTENSLPDAVACVRAYSDLGLAAALVLPPFYFREPATDGIRRFFETVLPAATIPVLAYHIPGLAPGVPVDVVAELGLWGAKDSSGDITYTRAVLAAGKSVLVGAEGTIIDAMRSGAAGTIAGMGNLLPQELAAVCAAVRAGEDAEARRALEVVLRLRAAILAAAPGAEWVAAFKQVAAHLSGTGLGEVRPPLVRRRDYLTDEVREVLRSRDPAPVS